MAWNTAVVADWSQRQAQRRHPQRALKDRTLERFRVFDDRRYWR